VTLVSAIADVSPMNQNRDRPIIEAVLDTVQEGSPAVPHLISDLCRLSLEPAPTGTRSSSMRLTQRERSRFITATNLLESCISNDVAVAHIAQALRLSPDDVVREVLQPIIKVKAKLDKGERKITPGPPRNKTTYFTEKVAVSADVVELHGYVAGHGGDRKTLYDQVTGTCPMDVHNMLMTYVNIKNLSTPSGIVIDAFLAKHLSSAEGVSRSGSTMIVPRINSKPFWRIIKSMIGMH